MTEVLFALFPCCHLTHFKIRRHKRREINKREFFGCLPAWLKQEDNSISIHAAGNWLVDFAFKNIFLAEIFFLDGASRWIWKRGKRKQKTKWKKDRKKERKNRNQFEKYRHVERTTLLKYQVNLHIIQSVRKKTFALQTN